MLVFLTCLIIFAINTMVNLQDLHHPAMRDRHWKMLMQTTGKQFVMDDKFCLGDLLALELHNYVDACSEIVDRWVIGMHRLAMLVVG